MIARDTMHREICNISIPYFQFMLRMIYKSRAWEWADTFVMESNGPEIAELLLFPFPGSEAFENLKEEHESLIVLLTDPANVWREATLYRRDHEERP